MSYSTFAELPGPHRWLKRIERELARGRSVIVQVPARVPTAEIVAAVQDTIPGNLVVPQGEAPEAGSKLWSWLAGLTDRTHAGPSDVIKSLAEHFCLVDVSSNTDCDAAALVREIDRLLDLVRNNLDSDPGDQRPPTFVVIAPPCRELVTNNFVDLPFRGVIQRADTYVCVANMMTAQHSRGRNAYSDVDPVTVSTIVELAGPDLDLARTLADSWDGDPDSLDKLVPYEAAGRGRLHFGRMPENDIWRSWAEGLGDLWDLNRFTFHVRHDDRDHRLRRVWAAQARTLLPLIEQDRYELACLVKPNVGDRQWDPRREEFSAVRWEVNRRFRSKPALGDLAEVIHGLRNHLAHLSCVDAERLAEYRKVVLNASKVRV